MFLVVITPFITIEHPIRSHCQRLGMLLYSVKANTPFIDLHKCSESVLPLDSDKTPHY